MLEALDFVGQVAPIPHQFQISFFGRRVICFLRCDITFQRLYPEPFRSSRHPDQRGAIAPVPYIRAKRPLPKSGPSCSAAMNKQSYSHATISSSPRWTTVAASALPARRRKSRDGRRRAIALRRRRCQVGAAFRSGPIRANASRIVPSVSTISNGKPSMRPQICHSATMSSLSVEANSGNDNAASACASVTQTIGGVCVVASSLMATQRYAATGKFIAIRMPESARRKITRSRCKSTMRKPSSAASLAVAKRAGSEERVEPPRARSRACTLRPGAARPGSGPAGSHLTPRNSRRAVAARFPQLCHWGVAISLKSLVKVR